MARYLLAYSGGSMQETPEEQKAAMDRWMGWFEQLGSALADPGQPTGAFMTIGPGGSVSQGGAMPISGYSILEAGSLEEATKMAGACPLLDSGGTVQVHETIAMM